jgi:endopolyphosphatase
MRMRTHTTIAGGARHLFLAILVSSFILGAIGAPSQPRAQEPFDSLDDNTYDDADWDLDVVEYHPPPAARALRGRFLHITDLHPDPLYTVGVSTKHACHRKDSRAKKKHRSGPWGAPGTGCDSPLQLVNSTLALLGRDWADHIDFVVWTGDSARHDNDRRHPRTNKEIYGLNRMVARQMREMFTKKGVAVIPSLGMIMFMVVYVLLAYQEH